MASNISKLTENSFYTPKKLNTIKEEQTQRNIVLRIYIQTPKGNETSKYLCWCVCVCMCAFGGGVTHMLQRLDMYIGKCVCNRTQDNLTVVLRSHPSTLLFETGSLIGWNCPSSKTQGSTYLCLFSRRIASTYHYAQLFCGFWSFKSNSHGYMASTLLAKLSLSPVQK